MNITHDKTPVSSNYRVLVLDDDPDVCPFISAALSEINIDVSCVEDPALLDKKLNEYKPHILLLDIVLPNYDGLALLKKLHEDANHHNLIIVIITFLDHPSIDFKAYTNNAHDILYKPLEKKILQKRLKKLL